MKTKNHQRKRRKVSGIDSSERVINSHLFFTSFLIIFFLLPVFAFAEDTKAETAIFAGGCFWCMEPPYEDKAGVIDVRSGYAGGSEEDANYKKVSRGGTAHKEVIEIRFNPNNITYKELLDIYWRNIDPFDAKGQFCDKGPQYQSAIYPTNPEQRKIAEASRKEIEKKFGRSVVTEILPRASFYPAEEYHQDYHEKNPLKYKYYRYRCGRDGRLKEVWSKVK